MDRVESSEQEQVRVALRIDLSNPEQRIKYEVARRALKVRLQPLIDATRDAKRLTGDDYKQRINY